MRMLTPKNTCAVILLILSTTNNYYAEREVPKICGDCWCISDSGTCPEYTAGHEYYSLCENIKNKFKSLKLKNDNNNSIPRLLSKEGTSCYPFSDSVGPLDKYPESNLPPCEAPPTLDSVDSVCAFKYDESFTEYSMQTYESKEKAGDDGAFVTHSGHCGVCSSAQDLAVYGTNTKTEAQLCSQIGIQKRATDPKNSFSAIYNCYKEKLDFTDDCALLWAHYSAFSITPGACLDICTSEILRTDPIPDSGEPPLCVLSNCLNCTEGKTFDDLVLLGGRSFENSGFVTTIARKCEVFYAVVHDVPSLGGDDDTNCSMTNDSKTSGGRSCLMVGVLWWVGVMILCLSGVFIVDFLS